MDFNPIHNETEDGRILKSIPLSGGCIGGAWKVETDKGIFFIKHYSTQGLAEEEALGLREMEASKTVTVPRPVRFNDNFLMLEFITPGRHTR